jgi:hypothetical protein
MTTTNHQPPTKKAITRPLRMMAYGKCVSTLGYDIRSCSTGIVMMPVTVTTTVTNELRMGRRAMFERYSRGWKVIMSNEFSLRIHYQY